MNSSETRLVDELAARRRQPATRAPDHNSDLEYSSFVGLLLDAARVLDDLNSAADGRLLVTRDEISFTTHRLRCLIEGAVVSAREQGL